MKKQPPLKNMSWTWPGHEGMFFFLETSLKTELLLFLESHLITFINILSHHNFFYIKELSMRLRGKFCWIQSCVWNQLSDVSQTETLSITNIKTFDISRQHVAGQISVFVICWNIRQDKVLQRPSFRASLSSQTSLAHKVDLRNKKKSVMNESLMAFRE